MNTTNLHAGSFNKYLNVTSNAKNTPTLKLTMTGTFRPILELDPANSIRIPSAKGKDTFALLTVKTDRKDFKITDMSFKENGKDMDWKNSFHPTFTMTLADSGKNKGDSGKQKKDASKGAQDTSKKQESVTYQVKITCAFAGKADLYGELVIKTTIPEKPELKYSCSIEAKKE